MKAPITNTARVAIGFRDVPRFPEARYEITVDWRDLEGHIGAIDKDRGVVMEPDYQRGHVWTDAQRSAYIEYGLMGGESSMVITVNCAEWISGLDAQVELLDGLQRVTAVRMFLRGDATAFGQRVHEFGDIRRCRAGFRWRVLTLATRVQVLRQYLLMNSGGVVHSPKEIARVRALLDAAQREGDAA